MRAKILKTIDESLLDKAIDLYLCQHPLSTKCIYLIMSNETLKELNASIGETDAVLRHYVENSVYGSVYKGNKIAICEFIPFGEVEIR